MPYNPGIAATNQGLVDGIRSFGESIAKGINRHYERKREKEREAAAESFFAANAERFGLDPNDKPALRAGLKAAGGAEAFLRVAGFMEAMEQQQRDSQKEKRIEGILSNFSRGATSPYPAEMQNNPFLRGAAQVYQATGRVPDPQTVMQFLPKQSDPMQNRLVESQIAKNYASIQPRDDSPTVQGEDGNIYARPGYSLVNRPSKERLTEVEDREINGVRLRVGFDSRGDLRDEASGLLVYLKSTDFLGSGAATMTLNPILFGAQDSNPSDDDLFPDGRGEGSSEIAQARKWLEENPNDPRAPAVRAKLGL